MVNRKYYIILRLEAFTATELDKIFSDNKLCQLWIEAQHHSPDGGGGDGL
jgi:hypothetical protein